MQNKFVSVKKEYENLVISVVSRFSSDPETRKDLEAGIWEKIWNNSERLEVKYGNTAGFIKKLAYNHCVDVYRAKKDIVKFTDLSEPSSKETPENLSEEKENLEYFEKVLDKLPEKERIIILMFYIECYPVKKVAKEMKMSESAIKVMLFRTRKKIKGLLSDMNYF